MNKQKDTRWKPPVKLDRATKRRLKAYLVREGKDQCVFLGEAIRAYLDELEGTA